MTTLPSIKNIEPSVCGNGPYHPAVKTNLHQVYYWPNITCNTPEKAMQEAKGFYMAAILAAQDVINDWNVDVF